MPRKAKPPQELVIQALSTGEIIREREVVDDLSGELIPVAEMYGPWLPPVSADALARRLSERKQAHAQAILAKAGWYKAESVGHKPFKRRL